MAPPETLSLKPQRQALRVFQGPRQVHTYLRAAFDNPVAVVPVAVEGDSAAVVVVSAFVAPEAPPVG